jgi:endonuclease/exonuclease/phosphatase family metal-dependent hydrolase
MAAEAAIFTASAATSRRTLLRLLTLNTHKGFSLWNRRFMLPELRDALRDLSPDIVFLQEVIGAHTAFQASEPLWPVMPQWEFLAEEIWGYSAYGRNAVYTEGHHGNAVLSKHPIVAYQNHDVSVGDVERRGLLHCTIDIEGEPKNVHAICVHLGLRERQRRPQLKALCALSRLGIPAAAPLIVAGDFNDWRQRAHAPLQDDAGMKEAFVSLQGRAARTYPVRHPVLCLDRVYCRNLQPERCANLSTRPWSHLSDHSALYVEARL